MPEHSRIHTLLSSCCARTFACDNSGELAPPLSAAATAAFESPCVGSAVKLLLWLLAVAALSSFTRTKSAPVIMSTASLLRLRSLPGSYKTGTASKALQEHQSSQATMTLATHTKVSTNQHVQAPVMIARHQQYSLCGNVCTCLSCPNLLLITGAWVWWVTPDMHSRQCISVHCARVRIAARWHVLLA